MSIRPTTIHCLRLAFACLSLLSPASRAADAAAIRATVDHAVRPLMTRYEVPGMAVAVTVDGKTMFFNYGVASKQSGVPVSEHTLFELGSISKTFAATLASYAQVLGKLSLADHPGKYMPALKGSAIDKASLLDLGTYTAGGLPLQFPEAVNIDRMPAYFRDWKPDAPPGTQRRYSNPSLGLFGHLAALSLQSSYGEAVEQRIFPALGLAHTHVHVPDGAMANYAWGYDRENQPVRVRPDVFVAETYGVKSSAADMIRFVQANIDPGQLAGPLRRAVQGTQIGYVEAGTMVQGLGWEQYRPPLSLQRLLAGNSAGMINDLNPAHKLIPPQTPPRGTLFNKTGSTRGFGSYVAFVPEQRIGVVLLANKNYPIPARVEAAYAILEQLAPLGQASAPPAAVQR